MDRRSGAVAAFLGRRFALSLACLLLLPLAGELAAQSPNQDGTALEDIVSGHQGGDPWSLRVVSIRCTSFYISASAMEKEDRPALAAQYEENAELFLSKALAMSREDKEILIGHLTRLARMYYVLSQAARDSSGDPFEHPLLRADLRFCMRLAGLAWAPPPMPSRPG